MLLQKCCNLEPRDSSYKTELEKVQKLINDFSSLTEFQNKEDWARVEEICDKLLKETTAMQNLNIIYIKALLNNVKLTEALSFIEKLDSTERSSNPDYKYYAALGLYYDGNYQKSKMLIKDLLSQGHDEPKYTNLFKKLKEIENVKVKANALFKDKKFEEAIEEYGKALEFDPTNKKFNSVIHANRSVCYKKLNKNTEALKEANISVQLNPNYAGGYLKRGNIYMELQMYSEAKFDFQKAKELNSNDADGYLEQAKKAESKAKKTDYYAILGVDRNTVLHWCKQKGLKNRKVGRYRIVNEKDLFSFLEQNQKLWDATKCESWYFQNYKWFEKKRKEDFDKMVKKRWGNVS